jgi:hypothetical protein
MRSAPVQATEPKQECDLTSFSIGISEVMAPEEGLSIDSERAAVLGFVSNILGADGVSAALSASIQPCCSFKACRVHNHCEQPCHEKQTVSMCI